MIAFCREVDKRTGKIAVYPLKAEVNDRLLSCLQIRSRINPELRYFVTTKAHWEGFSDVIIRNFKRKEVTRITIEGIGGIVEL